MAERSPDEGYGNPYELGYPYSMWRHFPFNPNHQKYDMERHQYHMQPSEVSITCTSEPYPSFTRWSTDFPHWQRAWKKDISWKAQVNQRSADEWHRLEAEMAAGVQARKTKAIWLQADYHPSQFGSEDEPTPLPHTRRTFIEMWRYRSIDRYISFYLLVNYQGIDTKAGRRRRRPVTGCQVRSRRHSVYRLILKLSLFFREWDLETLPRCV